MKKLIFATLALATTQVFAAYVGKPTDVTTKQWGNSSATSASAVYY